MRPIEGGLRARAKHTAPAQAGGWTMKLARNCRWILAVGMAVVFTGAARAQDSVLSLGQPRTYRWNDQRTGYGFYSGSNIGAEANQMPATTTTARDTTTNQDVAVPNPDLTWIYPLDLEGRPPDDPGNLYPQGYRLGEIHSSPTVASIDATSPPTLAVMFGSGTFVRRDLRNELPGPNGTSGRPSIYVDPDTGNYESGRDPYAYLNGQNTGAVFALEAFAGTREEFDAGPYDRNYRPLWWYGVRNLPYYTAADNDITPSGQPGDVTFDEAPYEAMSRFYSNASDTAMRAFDYGPDEPINANNFLPLPDTSTGSAQNTRRLRIFSQYIAPDVEATRLDSTGRDTGPGYDSGAGVVAKGRPDIPKRLTDRLYNLNITGARFGINDNRAFLGTGGGSGDGRPDVGPLNNRFRLASGMGEIRSTGVFVRLPDADAVTYTSEYYRIQADGSDAQAAALNDYRRDPRNIQRDTGITTSHLYIVGSDDGYVYAFDANPGNARQVGASTNILSTYMGRLVWAFRAALRPPLYVDKDTGAPLTIAKFASGEQVSALDGQTRVIANNANSALATTQNTAIITGGITSSPVVARITLPDTAFNFAGQTRTVVFIGTAIGRMFCLDAQTGQEIWEFKTTPRDYTLVQKGGNFYSVDGVTGYPITTSPTLGWLPAATSQLHPAAPGRLGLFFGADDGKVYALDAADGSPLTGWDVAAQRVRGSRRADMADLTPGTRGLVDHYGFVTYSFEDTSNNPLSTTAIEGKFGRRLSDLAQPVRASVVARPAGNGAGYTEPDTGRLIPEVDLLFVSSTTNQRDAAVGENPGFTGGSIFGVSPDDGSVVWTFDRWSNPTRATNGQFDKETGKDQYVRPGAFSVTPAYATNIRIYDEAGTGTNGRDGETDPLKDQNVLFAVDSSGQLFALDGDTGSKVSENRLFWKLPYPLPGAVGQSNGIYSSPVVSSPITEGDQNASYSGRSYVFVGVSGGIVAVDTVAVRTDLVTGADNKPLASGQYTGGAVAWGWETPRDSVTIDTGQDPPVAVITSSAAPVVTTPAIYTGYVYAGADNGFLYAWSNQLSNFTFGGAGSGGLGRFRGGRQRPPIPQNQRPSGSNQAPVSTTFYADIFQAGFAPRQYGATKFSTPDAINSIRPVGVPPGANTQGGSATPVSPPPVGTGEPDFSDNGGTGILEWGDPVVVVAWGEALDKIVQGQGGAVDPDKLGTVTLKLTGSGVNASLRANIEFDGGHAYARQVFYLNPFTTTTPASLRYPKAPASEVGNPLFGAPLTPGSSVFTVSAEYRGPSITTTDSNGKPQTQPGTRFTSTAASTKFRVANPLNITGRFERGRAPEALVALDANPYNVEDARRNGNERVPVQTSVIGDHGTPTKASPDSVLRVMDRSNLVRLRNLANGRAMGTGNDIYLRVRVDAAPLRWTGGPQAAYKPLLAQTQAVPNGIPLQNPMTPPEPLYTTYWGPQLSSIFDVSLSNAYIGAEQPPARMGETNNSRDYPDMQATVEQWKMQAQPPYSRSDIDASSTDAPVIGDNVSPPPSGLLYLQAAIPKYQPANYAAPGRDPSSGQRVPPLNQPVVNPGLGPGYYTINPTNSTAMQAALMGWDTRGSSSGAGPYFAFNQPQDNGGNVQQYAGPMGMLLPPSPTLVAQERGYLTKVYVDLNGNGNADTGSEPYRMFVSGVQVRPDERLNVTAATVEIPQGPEKDIPGGYIPFQFYYDRQAVAAGAGAGEEDPFLFGERNFYAPFTVYNQGNVNLWSVRLAKYDPGASHLVAPGVDTNPFVGASGLSNWPASGILKRTNLVSTLDALPKAPGSGPGASTDPSLWTPAPKPRVGISDEGQGQIMQVKDVFAFLPANGVPSNQRAHVNQLLANPPGRPYLSVAVPPGTPPGKYVTNGPLVLFEDSGPPYNNSVAPYNGVLDLDVNGNPMETGVPGDAQVLVTVGESRLTDKVSRIAPNIPQVDAGVAFAATYAGGTPTTQAELTRIWQTLAQDATPSAYRDPRTGDLVTFWSSNRVGLLTDTNGFQALPGLTPDAQVADRYHIFASAMTWQDPLNPPISPNADVSQFLTGVMAKNPWGWQYQGGNRGNFFFPNFGQARWFGPPSVQTWIPDAGTVNAALGLPAGATAPDLTYTSPAPITDFHGTQFPPVVFWTGSTGTGAGARSAIFYAPVTVDRATGTVGTSAGIQAVGVTGGSRTLDPFVPKFAPQPFLITTGGAQTATAGMAGTSYLQNEQVTGLGVVWFGGAPGAWKLFVSTIATDAAGNPTGNGQWKTEQLDLPDGISSAMYPSAYYAQDPAPTNSGGDRQGIVNIAFSGYSSSGRNPDIYVARYRAAQGGSGWSDAKIGDFRMLSFKRQGGISNTNEAVPTVTLEQLERVPNEPRPIYRSHWAQWMGRRGNGVTVYWFKKPVATPGIPGRINDYQLFATFTSGSPGGSRNTNVREISGRLAPGGDTLPGVTAFIDAGAGTVRFATTDPVKNPAPLSRPYQGPNGQVQDFIFLAATPSVLRVTTDNDVMDTQPRIWLDQTHEAITDPGRTNMPVAPGSPLLLRRDRMWVVWRRSAQPEGVTRASGLFYQTFRVGVDLGAPLPVDRNGRVLVTVKTTNGEDVATEVDADKGRIYFGTEFDGTMLSVAVNNGQPGLFAVGWVPENTSAPAPAGSGDGFYLPLTHWPAPRVVPTSQQGNDSQPWIFKDPFSDLPPGTPEYFARGNNDMWLFWSSTRPSQSVGAVRASPTLGGPSGPGTTGGPDPYYFTQNGLMYTSSASDVYYTTISPDFAKR